MDIITRAAQPQDRLSCVWIESGAMPSITYIDEVWPVFTAPGNGELTVALVDGDPCGMGKLTVLYGGYGWLESLRVHPDYQNMGLGKAIYRRYMQQMTEMNLSAVGMYTGIDNTHSRHLAELYGLSVSGEFSEYRIAARSDAVNPNGFTAIAPEEAEEIFAPLYSTMGEFITVNRTFYPVRPGLAERFAQNGWAFRCGDTIVLAGSRFQPYKLLHLPYVHGDWELAARFAHSEALRTSAAQISAIRPLGMWHELPQLKQAGFAKTDEDFITMWKGL